MRVLSNLDADLNRIMRVPAPDADMDAVSKAYVEDVSQGIYDDLFAYGASITFLASRYDILSSGWDIAEIWTYVSPTSFSINGDKRDKYQKGDKIRLKQGGDWKYFYITGVSYSAPNTIVTITGGSDYTLANAAIQNNQYSKAENPQGFPGWFNWTPTYTGFSSEPSGGAPSGFKISNGVCWFYHHENSGGTSNSTAFTISLPVQAAATTYVGGVCRIAQDNSVLLSNACRWTIKPSNTVIDVYTDMASTGWTASGTKRVSISGFYLI